MAVIKRRVNAAMALNLSLVSPYLDKGADFASGVNFAVAGATALDRSVLLLSGVMAPPASVPLSSQLDWFKAHLNATCPSQEGSYVLIWKFFC
jgi:hypothetical protein